MLDPSLIFLELFGGALLGLLAGIVRRRGIIDTIIYIVVAEVFGLGLVTAVGRVNFGILSNDIRAVTIMGLLYIVPLFGGLIGVTVVGLVSRRVFGGQPNEPTAPRGYGIIKIVAQALLGLAVLLLILSLIAKYSDGSLNLEAAGSNFIAWIKGMLPFVLLVLSGYATTVIARRT
jgi:hypothetical protein